MSSEHVWVAVWREPSLQRVGGIGTWPVPGCNHLWGKFVLHTFKFCCFLLYV